MARILVLQHFDREGPLRIGELASERGHVIEVVRLDRGDAVPERVAQGEALVVMGGSMGVGDRDDPRWPFLRHEIALLSDAIARRQPILGVCLGAQLLAHAAGARVYPNTRPGPDGRAIPAREVGWGQVNWREGVDPVLAAMPATTTVLHWHGDTFDLPAAAVHLAWSDACRNQAFRLGERAFGLQFHVEADARAACRWADEDAEFVIGALGHEGPARIRAESPRAAEAARPAGDRLLSNILGAMGL